MRWKKLVFKQNQPIHLGKYKHGVINETRIFIPGQTMWGALLNKLGIVKNWDFNKYKENKELFDEITCFYPCLNKEGHNVNFPNYKKGEFYLGRLSEKEFRYNFTDTFVSTAINSNNLGASEKSLHEIDFILPQSKQKCEQLYWIGCIYSKTDFFEKGMKIKVGGKRNYGYGELELVETVSDEDKIDLKKWINDNLNFTNATILTNYLQFNNNIKFEGELELLPEIDFFNKSTENGKNILYIKPGSKLILNKNQNLNYDLIKGKLINRRNK